MAYEKIVSVPSTATSGQVPQADGAGGFSWGDIAIPESGVQMDLLWENASPYSSFAGQTILLDLTSYEMVRVEGYDVITTLGTLRGNGWMRNGNASSYLGDEYVRTITVDDNGVTFSDCQKSSSIMNSYNRPLFIYGIKGVKTV